MTMHADQLVGTAVIGSDGQAVGTVEQVFRDDQDGTPSWARMRSGDGGHFIPLAGSSMTKSGLSVPFDTQKIVKEPDLGIDQHMSVGQEEELRRYFGLTVPAQVQAGQSPVGQVQAGQAPAGQAQAGQAEAGQAQAGREDGSKAGQEWLVRAEERLAVSKEMIESGRVRLRKYVDTDPVEQPVHVFHEEYEVERVPITAEDRISGALGAAGEQEIVLHEERVVFRKEAIPVERVRLSARKVEEEKTVRGEIRKERIEVETEAVSPAPQAGQGPDDADQRRSPLGRHRSSQPRASQPSSPDPLRPGHQQMT
jgi:uncharacterized protein (TIGR02271 family)